MALIALVNFIISQRRTNPVVGDFLNWVALMIFNGCKFLLLIVLLAALHRAGVVNTEGVLNLFSSAGVESEAVVKPTFKRPVSPRKTSSYRSKRRATVSSRGY